MLDFATRTAPAGGVTALALAESLCVEGRYTDALLIGQSLLTRPAGSDRELAKIHRLVAQCLVALGERRMAARHQGLAGPGAEAELPQRRATDDTTASRPAVRTERCFVFAPSRPAYWPAERRGRG